MNDLRKILRKIIKILGGFLRGDFPVIDPREHVSARKLHQKISSFYSRYYSEITCNEWWDDPSPYSRYYTGITCNEWWDDPSPYSRYYTGITCNEWWDDPSPHLSAWATQLRKNIAALARCWQYCVRFDWTGIEP